jgi:hypothetical protein
MGESGMIIVDQESVPERPITTVNRLLTSAVNTYGRRVIGVLVSGFLRDGTVGLRAVHEAGGITVVQDPGEALYPSMPASAMEDLPVTFCLNLSDIGAALESLVRRTSQFETGLEVVVRYPDSVVCSLPTDALEAGSNLEMVRALHDGTMSACATWRKTSTAGCAVRLRIQKPVVSTNRSESQQ